MTGQKLASVSHVKGEVPDAFRKIRAMLAKPPITPFDRYTGKGLQEELKEAEKELWGFWFEHSRNGGTVSRRKEIFEKPFHWSEEHHFAAIGMERPGDVRHPSEELMHLLVLLSEHDNDLLFRHGKWVFKTIDWSGGIGQGELVRMLNVPSLNQLMFPLGAGEIIELLVQANRYDTSNDTRLVEKIVRASDFRDYHNQLAKRLGKDLVETACSPVIGILRRTGDENAREIADHLVECLEHAKKVIDATLNALGGEGR